MNHLPSEPPHLLTREYVESQLCMIFADAIILNYRFEITAINPGLAKEFKCRPSALVGQSVNCLSDFDIASEVSELMKHGHFTGQCFMLKDADSRKIKATVSGFHLGLISDLNETIALFVKNVGTQFELNDQLKTKEAAMDDLLYKASHDLRGPIATILGIVNIARLRPDDKEVDKLFEYIGSSAKMLDERLREAVSKNASSEKARMEMLQALLREQM